MMYRGHNYISPSTHKPRSFSMKLLLLASAFVASTSVAFGQAVTETVNFDTYTSAVNNDLANSFIPARSRPNVLTQMTTSGITGGAVMPPNSANYANDVAQYCSTYNNQLGVTTSTSMCFKFNAALVNLNSNDDPLDFFLDNYSNNDGLILGLRHSGSQSQPFYLSIVSYSSVQTIPLANSTLVTGHWYRLTARFRPIGGTFNDQSQAQLELFELGAAGTATPVSLASLTSNLSRPALVSSPSYNMGIMGNKWGGAELLDNFSFSGYKAGSLCTVLASRKPTSNESLQVVPNPSSGNFSVLFGGGFNGKLYKAEILNLIGQQCAAICDWDAATRSMKVDAAHLPPGSYIVQMHTSEGTIVKRFLVE